MRGGDIGIVRPERRGPAEGEELIGFDRGDERRPGVPMAAPPESVASVAGRALALQEVQRGRHLHRTGLDRPTPVFGTAQPHHGLSGALRKAAYHVPEHHARHWMLLLLADRTDHVEERLGAAFARRPERVGAGHVVGRVRARRWLALGLVAGAIWLARR